MGDFILHIKLCVGFITDQVRKLIECDTPLKLNPNLSCNITNI